MLKPISIVLFWLAAAGLFSSSALRHPAFVRAQTVSVYICDSKDAVAYHKYKTCRGLQKCTHQVLTVTESEAIDRYGRRACKICY